MKIRVLLIVLSVSAFSLVLLITQNNKANITLRYLYEDLFLTQEDLNLLIGSSTIARLDSTKLLHCNQWLNRGLGQASINDLQRYLTLSFQSINPDRILIYAGENDASEGLSVSQVTFNYKQLVEWLMKKYPRAEIHILAIKPSPARHEYWADFKQINKSMLAYFESHSSLTFHVSLWGATVSSPSEFFLKDGIHLTDEGYKIFLSGFTQRCLPK